MLFIATILLVGLERRHGLQRLGLVALERYGSAYLFLIKQAMWAALGWRCSGVVMRIDYRTYREPVFIWTCLGVVALALVAVLFSAPVNGARRWFGVGGIGVQPSELAKLARDLLHRRAARAAHAPHRRGRLRAAADRHRGRSALVGADPARAGLRHVDVARC